MDGDACKDDTHLARTTRSMLPWQTGWEPGLTPVEEFGVWEGVNTKLESKEVLEEGLCVCVSLWMLAKWMTLCGALPGQRCW